jgi:predicted nucleic acid-binding protein
MHSILVDSNALLDVITQDPRWSGWSSEMIARYSEEYMLAVNPVIYAEVSIGFTHIEDLEQALPPDMILRLPIPWEAAFLAGKCFVRYRRRGGARRSPLPDFFIGAHAAVEKLPLITRDPARYRTYFPTVKLISP